MTDFVLHHKDERLRKRGKGETIEKESTQIQCISVVNKI